MADLYRFSVAQYHQLMKIGILQEKDYVELIEGYLVLQKRPRSPLHAGTLHVLWEYLRPLMPDEWMVRVHSGVTLSDSEPEPDLAIVRHHEAGYMQSHPTPPDIAVLIEVADWTLALDRVDKCRIYARAGVPYYWIVNLVDQQIEVYSSPMGGPSPEYRDRVDMHLGDEVEVMLDGQRVGSVSVSAVLG